MSGRARAMRRAAGTAAPGSRSRAGSESLVGRSARAGPPDAPDPAPEIAGDVQPDPTVEAAARGTAPGHGSRAGRPRGGAGGAAAIRPEHLLTPGMVERRV
ncbi:hypothetical protein GCM10018793_67300 [Streptomyces sulfonofaciens]|uniref:Uncharacterized protein n=1 Tax=Streptomyces sulfonofaciens TaxID=68272 RepID=A0A919LAS5_9ACTN|nr:hypothetical protein GCM10018793_67300 [Streptomyces sulfonofaciens]